MPFFIATLLVWIAALYFARPNPSSLRSKPPGYGDSFKKIRGTFWLGLVLIVLHLIFSEGTFQSLNEDWAVIFGINNIVKFTPWWFMQIFASNFFHFDFIHLWMNLVFLGLLSIYERRAGARRFLTVFLVGGVVSATSVLFITDPMVAVGASGGLYALAAAYLFDSNTVSNKKYPLLVGLVIVLFILASLPDFQTVGSTGTDKVNILGHFFGLLFGVVYCKLFPARHTPE